MGIIACIQYFGKRFTGKLQKQFLNECIKDLNPSIIYDRPFNPKVFQAVLEEAKIENMTLADHNPITSIVDISSEGVEKHKSFTNSTFKQTGETPTATATSHENKNQKRGPLDSKYVFLKRGNGIKFTELISFLWIFSDWL